MSDWQCAADYMIFFHMIATLSKVAVDQRVG